MVPGRVQGNQQTGKDMATGSQQPKRPLPLPNK